MYLVPKKCVCVSKSKPIYTKGCKSNILLHTIFPAGFIKAHVVRNILGIIIELTVPAEENLAQLQEKLKCEDLI